MLKETDLEKTKWILQVFAEVPACIDTLTFLSSGIGKYYACEHELSNRLTYRIRTDTVFIDQYELTSQVDASKGEDVITKYTLIMVNDRLKMVSIQHKHGSGFEEVNSKYLTRMTFNQLK